MLNNEQLDESFLKEMNISLEAFRKSNLSVETLKAILNDYMMHTNTLLDEAEYIAKKIQRCASVHSVRWRIKEPSHLIKKIVRKVISEQSSEKYKAINVNNYKTIITDLIGVRAIYLFKSDWKSLHEHILSRWEIAKNEEIIIYHREGDLLDIDDCQCRPEVHPNNYRSIHYVINATKIESNPICCEIQTRTIFEEGWSEIDHKVRYPDYSNNENLMNYLTIFNRLAGSADEMASYVNDLIKLIKKSDEHEHENIKRTQQYNVETDKLKSEIESLSKHQKSIEIVEEKYKEFTKVQQNEIERLNKQLCQYQSVSLDKYSMRNKVKILWYRERYNSNNEIEILVDIEVLYSSNLIRFRLPSHKKMGAYIKSEIAAIPPNYSNINSKNIRVRMLDDSRFFDVRIRNPQASYVETGRYRVTIIFSDISQ